VGNGINRPGALERHIQGISTKVLTDRLRNFTRAGVFERVQFPEIPPRVEYHLTAFGKKFLRLLKEVEKLQAELEKEREHNREKDKQLLDWLNHSGQTKSELIKQALRNEMKRSGELK
jgi:DNA-binding HxlR family transcriptional regulator